jgi:hypothetical protein
MMSANHIRKIAAGLLCALAVIFAYAGVSRSQFLDIDEETVKSAEEVKSEPVKEKRLPVYIARNVKAELMQGIKGAIRVTWEIDPATDEEFIVGRASEVPYTKERALAAKSIKVSHPAAERFAIDSNLPPGNYFYVVLAKSKIMERDVELYPNVNYTTVPAVIEKEFSRAPSANLPEKVTLIHALVVNRTQVLLTWKGVDTPGLVYNVYRAPAVLNAPEKIQGAEMIAQLATDKSNYIDKNIRKTGYYYYAVTTRDVKGNEDRLLVPDQSYTANGVFITMQTQSLVSNLKAELFAGKSVKLTWSEAGAEQRGKYLVYRDTKPITNSEKLALSEYIGSVMMGRSEFIDENPGRGALYYAVLGKLDDGTFDNTMVERANYTADPVAIGDRLRLVSIKAAVKEGGVTVTWKYSGEMGARSFSLVRVPGRIASLDEVNADQVVSPVDLLSKRYIDNPPAGKHYYALVPGDRTQWSDYALEEGVNITPAPAVTGGAGVKVEEKKVIIEKKQPPVIEEKIPVVPVETSGVDTIIRETFFRGRYNSAITRLGRVIEAGGSEREIAKARLFTGRAYIERGMYRKSLEYLLRSDVKQQFPRDARFWSSYAISKVGGK